ncbi:MAG: MFS transporter [Bacteroidia bacterium]|nr:MFS transporter [Bacteroidia bacterium]
MINKFEVNPVTAGNIVFILPFGTILLTPLFGTYIDNKGKGASFMILGSLLLILVHLIFAFAPGKIIFAYIAMFILGISFSLVPSAMWPSVPKIVEDRYLGTAYAFIFWIQNIGLWAYPMLIGNIREWSNPGITKRLQAGENVFYDYTNAMLLLVITGFIALICAFLLKYADRKGKYGLESPNKLA